MLMRHVSVSWFVNHPGREIASKVLQPDKLKQKKLLKNPQTNKKDKGKRKSASHFLYSVVFHVRQESNLIFPLLKPSCL